MYQKALCSLDTLISALRYGYFFPISVEVMTNMVVTSFCAQSVVFVSQTGGGGEAKMFNC